MIELSARAERQIADLREAYEEKGRSEAVQNLINAIIRASDRIRLQPYAGLAAPRPYPQLAHPGERWIKEGRYWIAYTLSAPPVIVAVFYDQANYRAGPDKRKSLAQVSMINRALATFLLSLAGIAVTTIATVNAPGKTFPACNNEVATARLAGLYDNQRLLRASTVDGVRFSSDAMLARHYIATVTWTDQSVSQVRYDFVRTGRRSQHLSMWIDYNDGMWGPSFF